MLQMHKGRGFLGFPRKKKSENKPKLVCGDEPTTRESPERGSAKDCRARDSAGGAAFSGSSGAAAPASTAGRWSGPGQVVGSVGSTFAYEGTSLPEVLLRATAAPVAGSLASCHCGICSSCCSSGAGTSASSHGSRAGSESTRLRPLALHIPTSQENKIGCSSEFSLSSSSGAPTPQSGYSPLYSGLNPRDGCGAHSAAADQQSAQVARSSEHSAASAHGRNAAPSQEERAGSGTSRAEAGGTRTVRSVRTSRGPISPEAAGRTESSQGGDRPDSSGHEDAALQEVLSLLSLFPGSAQAGESSANSGATGRSNGRKQADVAGGGGAPAWQGDVEKEKHIANLMKRLSRKEQLRMPALDAGCLQPLLQLCSLSNVDVALEAMTALYNISLNSELKPRLAPAIPCLAHALEHGNTEQVELACSSLYSLSVSKDMEVHVRIWETKEGVVGLLGRVLETGSLEAKLQACRALYNLSLDWRGEGPRVHEQVIGDIVSANAVPTLVSFLNNEHAGLVQKACLVLGNLARSEQGLRAVQESDSSICSLVEILDKGSPEAQEAAVVALQKFAESSRELRKRVWEEAPQLDLEYLGKKGTRRARAKANALLKFLSSLDDPRTGPQSR